MSSPLVSHFGSHLQELRKRVLISFLAIVSFTVVAYIFSEHITRFFMEPLLLAHPALVKLVYTNLTEAFVSYLKVSLLTGIIFSFPIVLYESWMFVAPGLLKSEKNVVLQVVLGASLLFAGGVAFAYFVVLPEALAFLMGFAREGLQPLPKLDSYLTFVARASLAFGLAFEIPFLMVVAGKTGIVGKNYFRKQRKYFYLIILVLAFLLTVGDLFSAFLLALPLIGLYEGGILILHLLSAPA